MDLTKFLKKNEIDEELIYMRGNKRCTAYPRDDCSIAEDVSEVDQMQKVSSAYYFYGQIGCEITEAKEKLESSIATEKDRLNENLVVRKSAVYLLKQQELEKVKARCTDKVLENLVNSDEQVISIKTQLNQLSKQRDMLIELRSAENKIKVILKALLLKQDDLIEISRRKKEELKSIGHLT